MLMASCILQLEVKVEVEDPSQAKFLDLQTIYIFAYDIK
jgi:hypothetical protein